MDLKLTIQKMILTALKEAYFRRAKEEKIGFNKQITQELDLLQITIKELSESIKNDKEN